jgi:hypothetical protein
MRVRKKKEEEEERETETETETETDGEREGWREGEARDTQRKLSELSLHTGNQANSLS